MAELGGFGEYAVETHIKPSPVQPFYKGEVRAWTDGPEQAKGRERALREARRGHGGRPVRITVVTCVRPGRE